MLLINPSKCQARIRSLYVKRSRASVMSPEFAYYDISAINIFESFKILGVIFTHDLSSNLHASTIPRKMKSMLTGIHRLNSSLNAESRLKIHAAFITLRVNYCLPVWGNWSHTASTGIDRSFKRTVPIIFGSSNLTLQSSTAATAGSVYFFN